MRLRLGRERKRGLTPHQMSDAVLGLFQGRPRGQNEMKAGPLLRHGSHQRMLEGRPAAPQLLRAMGTSATPFILHHPGERLRKKA